ncbi:hypothetical protein ABID22_003172 [Pontibacter aydingkolensis]|uniref:Uncharacterized protein n=1 Tax=Pontibacter aydingkolensis TaxID=1911536 RepID=A0ABS7CY97_9BACT|nr:hypothetical protein [Pontibacter aydingkolensis]MBW7468750.1 hypothetical protein [Pontibacter aydingkolensis]
MEKKHTASIRESLRVSGFVLVVGFLLNLIWENAQAPLYFEYKGFYSHFMICFVAAVVDALVILLLYLLFALFMHNLYWPLHAGVGQYFLLVFIGGVMAVWFERWAFVNRQWSYRQAMPIVPILDIGLLPLLQLMILPLLSIWISTHLALKRQHYKV